MEQYESGHLGGCVKGGDPATYYPNLWDFIIQDFGIKSILDIGCGEGHSVEYFKSKNIDVLGLEGCAEAIENSKVKDSIVLHDFNNSNYNTEKKFDAVWCCEFLEHVDQKYERDVFNTIYQVSAKYVFLTHAVPGQGGYHHVNLQHSSYWISKLYEYGYVLSAKSTRQLRELAFFENIIPQHNHFYNHGLVFVREGVLPEKEKNGEIDWGSDKFCVRAKNETDNAVITWASGKEFCKNDGIKVFVNSLNRCGYKGHKIVFTNDMDIDTREYFEKNYFKIIDVDPNKSQWVVRDRFLAWHNFLKNSCYWHVGLFDCKDVVFQGDPFQRCRGLTLISEGKKHSDCDWNMQDQTNLRKFNNYYCSEFKEDPIICAGTIMGEKDVVGNLCANIWSSTLLSGRCTDQAVLNFLHKTIYFNVSLSDPVLDDVCLTADLPKESPPILIDGLFCNALTKRPYHIYHQYDRVPENKKIIYERYLE